ncbi:MAG: hypothetical protein JST12_06890 [Armatimonadetes bacterium]|nr:hypothetical protein [Armatimonadota bacterium]MBS1701367.1 hypothetical protein [Armatimonadota bacterium]MBS1728387.1 hypothetical protein [Armatimonadota bacterium]
MEDIQRLRDTRTEEQMQTLVLRLKVCPVCNSLTRVEAETCTLCNWAGKFDTEVDHVAETLGDLLAKCPELLHTLVPEPQPTLIARLREFLSREIRFRKRLDLRA